MFSTSNTPPNGSAPQQQIGRREALFGLGGGLGALAFSSLLAGESRGEEKGEAKSDTSQAAHHPPRAKACIFLMMEGGPSHLDTFDPKPKLNDLHLQKFQRQGEQQSAMSSGRRYYVRSPFTFRRHGESGIPMSDPWRHLPSVADHLCMYRGCQVESVNHPTAMYQLNTGNRFAGDPAVGAWVTYGLGSPNENLPGFVVLPEVSYPQGGSANWGNGYLPASYQGTALRPTGTPILDLQPPRGVTGEQQRANLDLLQQLNQRHADAHPHDDVLRARMSTYELAFRMQSEVPELLDLSKESAQTLSDYGVNDNTTGEFGRKCLLARRLVEQGVRFVQLYAGTWDSHDYIERAHRLLIERVDRPIAALIRDLHQRGMLEETLVIWCGEFGRTPDNGVRGGVAYGRDHNPLAMPMWMAGGGVRQGEIVGATDEIGGEAVEVVHPIRDVHVTWLDLLGLDDNRLTYFHAGRFKQLSQFGGQRIPELMA